MTIRVKTKRLLIFSVTVITCFILGGMAFTSYFMHAVYETEDLEIDADRVLALVLETYRNRLPDAKEVVWLLDEGHYEAEFA